MVKIRFYISGHNETSSGSGSGAAVVQELEQIVHQSVAQSPSSIVCMSKYLWGRKWRLNMFIGVCACVWMLDKKVLRHRGKHFCNCGLCACDWVNEACSRKVEYIDWHKYQSVSYQVLILGKYNLKWANDILHHGIYLTKKVKLNLFGEI